jgi:hypothetical protein
VIAGRAIGRVSVALLPWCLARPGEAPRRYVTVVVRTRMKLVSGGAMVVGAEEPIAAREILGADGVPIEPGDLLPYLPSGEIWVRGRATVRRGAQRADLRLLVVRGNKVVFSKSASRAVPPGADAVRARAFEPIARAHPARAPLFGPLRATSLDDPITLWLGAATDPGCFHAAPSDQRCGFFAGDERLVLDGFFAEAARFETHLPGVAGVARVYGLARGTTPVRLRLDSIGIDLDRRTARLVFRHALELAQADRLEMISAAGGVECGKPLVFPEALETVEVPPRAAVDETDFSNTAAVDISGILAGLASTSEPVSSQRPALPFRPPSPTQMSAGYDEEPPASLGETHGFDGAFQPGPALPFESAYAGETFGFDAPYVHDFGALPFEQALPTAPSSPAPVAPPRSLPPKSAPPSVPSYEARVGTSTVGCEGVNIAALLEAGSLPFSPEAAGPRPTPLSAPPVAPPRSVPPKSAPPSVPSYDAPVGTSTVGYEGVNIAALLEAGSLPFSPEAAGHFPAAAAEEPSSVGGMTLGFDGASLADLLRPATPFVPPAHLGARPLILRPQTERPGKRLSEFFLEALQAISSK